MNEQEDIDSIIELRMSKDLLRASQRTMILDGLTGDQRALLNDLFPKDTVTQYTSDSKPTDPNSISPNTKYREDLVVFISPLDFEKTEGAGYEVLFQMICTAQTPTELTNIFRAVHALSRIKEPKEVESRIWRSYHYFLDKISGSSFTASLQPTTETQYISEEISEWSGEQTGRMDKTFVENLATRFFNNLDPSSYSKRKAFLLETFLYLTLNGNYSPRWREQVIEHMAVFNFGANSSAQIPESIFASNVSFWMSVDGSWAGIDISRQPEPETVLFASELTQDEREELERLRREREKFKKGEQTWLSKKFLLESEKVRLERDYSQLYQRTSRLEENNSQLQKRAEDAERELFSLRQIAGGAGQVTGQKITAEQRTDRFILGFEFTIDQIKRMSHSEKNRVINFLRREAGKTFHPDGGIHPDSKRLQAINSLLDELEK